MRRMFKVVEKFRNGCHFDKLLADIDEYCGDTMAKNCDGKKLMTRMLLNFAKLSELWTNLFSTLSGDGRNYQ